MTNEISDAEILEALQLLEQICNAPGVQVDCYDWDETGTLTLVPKPA